MNQNASLVADYLDTVKLRGRTPRTQRTYRYSLGRYLSYLGDTDLRHAAPRDIRGFLATEADAGTAPSSVVRFHGDLRTFYRWLTAEGEIEASPVDRVPAPVAPVLPVPTVPGSQLRKLLEVRGRGKFSDHRNRLVILLLADTGMRSGELLGINVADVNIPANTVTISGKTGPRTVGFGSRTAIELRRYLRVRETHRLAARPELLLSQRGALTYSPLWAVLRRYCERAGVDPVHAHQFRHSWATAQLQSEAGELTVMVAGGWSSTRHMQRYVREATSIRAAELNQRNSVVDGL